MKKKKFTLDQYANAALTHREDLKIKGGHTRLRRNRRTTIFTIWDDVDVRINEDIGSNVPDLTLRFFKRGG